MLKNTLRASNHPLSRALYDLLEEQDIITLDQYQEYLGKGIEATAAQNTIKIGSQSFVSGAHHFATQDTSVHISTNHIYKGHFVFHNKYRKGVQRVFNTLSKYYKLSVLSGDNEGEKEYLQQQLPQNTSLVFNQKPEDKLNYIKGVQEKGEVVVMIGDGLNDAGALAQSDVGIAISENVNVFSPACDAILDASVFESIVDYFSISKIAIGIIRSSFIFSFLYNVVGLYFAVTGQLSPVIAAILMPLSSISIVVYVTVLTNIYSTALTKKYDKSSS